MKQEFSSGSIVACSTGVWGLYLLSVSLHAIFSKKPFVISSRWSDAISLACVMGLFLDSVLVALGRGGSGMPEILYWLVPLVSIFVLVLMCSALWLPRYEVVAVTDASFRDGLLDSLNKLGLPHEEAEKQDLPDKKTLTVIRLPTVQADLEVEVDSRMGSVTLKMNELKFSGVLTGIAQIMNDYYKNATAMPVHLTGCKCNLILGVVLLLIAGLFTFLRL